jgi:integrase
VFAPTDSTVVVTATICHKEYELNNGLHRSPNRTTWETFREAFEREFVPEKRPSTQSNYRIALDHFESIVGDIKRMDQINARALSRYTAGLREVKTRSGGKGQTATVKVRLQFLRTALRWAARQGMLAAVPEFPRVKLPGRTPQPVPSEDVNRLLAACGDDQQMRVYLLCAWLAGCRRNEAAELRRSRTEEFPWVDFVGQRIWFPAEFVKGNADQWVPLDRRLAEELRALPERTDGRFFWFAPQPGQRPGRKKSGGVGLVRAEALGARVSRLARQSGVSLTYKSLRRGFGCRHAATVSAHVLQRLMRHANIETTLRYYANVDDAVMRAILGTEWVST